MIVVDTNLITSAFLRSQERKRAIAALERDADWRVPPLWRSEFLSACRHGIRTAGMDLVRCAEALDSAVALFGLHEVAPDPRLVLAAVKTVASLSSYDAEFLALGQQLGCRVVTQDLDFVRSARRVQKGVVVALDEYLVV